MVIIKRNVVDIGRGVVEQHGHGSAVFADGAREELVGDVVVVSVAEGDLVIRLTQVFAGILAQGVHRGDEPEDDVALLDVEAELGIDVVFDTVDVVLVVVVILVDTIEHQRVFLVAGSHTMLHAYQDQDAAEE